MYFRKVSNLNIDRETLTVNANKRRRCDSNPVTDGAVVDAHAAQELEFSSRALTTGNGMLSL